MAVKKVSEEELKQLPGFSLGVRDNSAVRMIKLGRPICPNSKMVMVKDETGKWVAADVQPQNCQLAGGKWWLDCVERGHDPYFTNRTWYETQDRIEVDEETGEEIIVGQKRIRHTNRYPNVAQVSMSIRHNSGRGARNKVENYGFVRLAELGYEEPCQYRNCQKAITVDGGHYGRYCSIKHLQLVAAAEQSIMLKTPERKFAPDKHEQLVRERNRQLREASGDVTVRNVK